MGRYAIGVDGGQSSTVSVLIEASGRVLGMGRSGPSNHITEPGGPERCQKAVADAVNSALASADLALSEIDFVLCGMTGAYPATEAAVARALPKTRHRMVHDSVTAFYGATGGRPGVVVIGGTGSVGYGEDAAGRTLRLGGWGYLMGDEGSAYWVALQAAQAVGKSVDQRGPETLLAELLPAAVGAGDMKAFHTWLYSIGDRSAIARLAGSVDQAARQGDGVARDILGRAGVELAELAVAVLQQLGIGEAAPWVSYVGGVFQSETLRRAYIEHVKATLATAQVEPPILPPVGGAALLAMREIAGGVGDEERERLRQGLIARFDGDGEPSA